MDKRFRSSSTEKSVQKSNTVKFDTKELKKTKVVIKRKISNSNETIEVDRTLERPEEIKIYRCRGEGSRPIFERSDVIVNKEDTEQRTVSTYCSPQRSSSRLQDNSHKSSDNYTSFGSDSPRRDQESRRNTRYSRSPVRENKSSRSNQTSSSPHRNIRPSPRRDSRPDFSSSSRNRSRSRDSSRRFRRSRSRSRSSRKEFGRRRNSRSPDDRDRRRYEHERRNYDRNERDRRHDRRRSPRYGRSSPRRRSSPRPHLAPIDPATVIPMIIPPFYGPEDAVWFAPPLRPPMMFPPGVPLPPRGMYRAPMPGFRPHLPGRPPYAPRQQSFRQIRPQNRPQL